MNLTEQELQAIEKEAEKLYPKPVAKKIPDDYYDEAFTDRLTEMGVFQAIHVKAATQERIKAKQLIKALEEIKSELGGEPYVENASRAFTIAVEAINYHTKQIEP